MKQQNNIHVGHWWRNKPSCVNVTQSRSHMRSSG